MKKVCSLLLYILFTCYHSSGQTSPPKVCSGHVKRVASFPSKYVATRTIDVWLPAGYSQGDKYAVLYMHDGQMLFDSDLSWNGQTWDADDVATALMTDKGIRKFIIVGIWNSGPSRHAEYFPGKPFEYLSQVDKDTVTAQLKHAGRTQMSFTPLSDNYLKFLVDELKPYIDATFSVFTNRENTFIAGSSMGGLISLYALCEYPNVFGGAACLSTHWTGTFTATNNSVPSSFIKYLNNNLPQPRDHKIYFDCGDKGLDALYPPIQKQIDSLMWAKGYNQRNWVTRYYPGEDHSEGSWNKRLIVPLRYLLDKKQ